MSHSPVPASHPGASPGGAETPPQETGGEKRGPALAAPALRGSLQAFHPLEVIQWLVPHPGEGVLLLESRAGEGSLLLESRAPGPAHTPHRESVPRLLLHCRAGEAVALRAESAAGDAPASAARTFANRLGALLLREGRIGIPQLRYALALQGLCSGRERHPLGEILRSHRWIADADLAGALGRLARRMLVTALGWRQGRFAFFPGPLPPPALPLGVRLDRLLLEIARALDETDA